MRSNSRIYDLVAAPVVFLSLCVTMGCGSDQPVAEKLPEDPTPVQIDIPGVGTNGIFDPGPAQGPSGTLWMSYSEVDAHPSDPRLPLIISRVARSDDDGATWTDAALVTDATPVTLPPPNDVNDAAWIHEVSRLLYDPYAAPGERWKIMWHRYLAMWNGGNQRLFEHGWIGVRAAAAPDGPWSPERKLFTGLGYDTNNDATIGPPEFAMHVLFPDAAELENVVLFTEPAMLARPEGIYVAIHSAFSTYSKISLLLCAHDFSAVSYVGDLLTDADAVNFGASYDGFSAPELVETSNHVYLIATPTEGVNREYRGCLVFRVTDIATATIERSAGIPVLVEEISGTPGSFNGACGYTPGSDGGVIFSQHFLGETPEFRLFASGKGLP